MVLNKNELTRLINNNNLIDDYLVQNIKSASYDLRIGTIYKGKSIYSESYDLTESRIEIKPSEIVTLLTFEAVKIPNDCCGTVFALNSMSSSGFLILNPGHIDPGYYGPISVCAINLSNNSIFLEHKQSIFTLVMNKLDTLLDDEDLYKKNTYSRDDRKKYEKKRYDGKFSNLSNSFFDLISNHKDGKEMLISILKKSIKDFIYYILKFLGFISLIIALIKGVNYFREDDLVKEKIELERNIELLKKQRKIDSISLIKKQRSNDSINLIIRNHKTKSLSNE